MPEDTDTEVETQDQEMEEVRSKGVSGGVEGTGDDAGATSGRISVLTPPAERREEDRLRTGDSTLIPPMTTAQLASILEAFKGADVGAGSEGARGADALGWKGDLVRDIASYSGTGDLSAYIRGLEAQLREIGIPKTEWKRVLLGKLPSNVTEKVATQIESGEKYRHIKEALVRSNGKCLRMLAIEYFPNLRVSSRDRVELARKIIAEVERISMLCPSREDLKIFIAQNYYASVLSQVECSILNGYEMESLKDLMDIAMTLRNTQLTGSRREKQDRGGGFEKGSSEKSGSDGPKCFICRKKGHKAYNCPERKQLQQSKTTKETTTTQTKRTNLVRSGLEGTSVQGVVNGTECSILPDSGCTMTIVPKRLVLEAQMTDEWVVLEGFEGG